jgi:hypothetical protein
MKHNRKTITPLIEKAYELNFGCNTGVQDKLWALHIVCANCAVYLRGWLKGSRKSMPFAVPNGLAITKRSFDRLLLLFN